MALSGGWWGRAVARARGAGRLLRGEAWPWRARPARYISGRGPGPPAASELDKADAWLLRKAHETGFLSWFRNGLLATGVGVISYVQSDMGREAAYGFFILGGICVSYGSASYLVSLFLLRRTMMLSFSTALLNCAAVTTVALFWLCAISLYIGRLEVEIIQDDGNDKCQDKKKEDGKSDK
ncbi:transmembrane protein 160 [Eublepharis macularius]|uniref:Transmembrane protein 160 n=1 Tax=Eublepharis macularius TaxID=481883 RepID=A0AA97LK43_EUBMA|nr:transmembrane protein 160 [Eublepharis macularius]